MPTPQTTPSDPTCPGLIGRDFFLIRLALPLLFLIAATRPVLAQIPPGAAELRIYAGLHAAAAKGDAAEIARLMAAGATPNMQDAREGSHRDTRSVGESGRQRETFPIARAPHRSGMRGAAAMPRWCGRRAVSRAHEASVRATRKPMKLKRVSAKLRLRAAERSAHGLLNHDPPRCARRWQSPVSHADPSDGAPS